MKTSVVCAQCGCSFPKENGQLNRALRIGSPLYCGRSCAGIARRDGRTEAERKEAKRLYDIEYCKRNAERLIAQKREYFRRTYDPVTAAKKRKQNMPKHVAYCRRPTYRAYKKEYDRRRLMQKQYGEFAEAASLLIDLENELSDVLTPEEWAQLKFQEGTVNKWMRRHRALGKS